MLRRIVLLAVIAALSAAGGAYASTQHSAKKQPAAKLHGIPANLHYPCHSPGAHLTPAQL
jgi:hypothetical protein